MTLPLALVLPLLSCHTLAAAPLVAGDAPAAPRNVAILVYDGVELLDFSGPGEVFAAARGPDGRAFRVFTVAKEKRTVRSQNFVDVTPEFSIADCPEPDIVVLPGGNVPADDHELQDWVRSCAPGAELIMSVCNGALLLGRTGLLDGFDATTHHGSLDALADVAPKTRVLTNRRFVDNGRVMTCAGVSAGIDGALHVVERLLGDEAARGTAHYMEYEWRPEEIAKLHAQPGALVGEGPIYRLAELAAASGVEAALKAYRADAARPTEEALNGAGFSLLQRRKGAQARAMLELAVAAFPDSANALDSLAEACEALGDAPAAIRSSEQALAKLDSTGAKDGRARAIRSMCTSRLARLGKADKNALRFGCAPCGGQCDRERFAAAGVCPVCAMPLVEAAN